MKEATALVDSADMEAQFKVGADRLGEILGTEYNGRLTGTSLNIGYSTLMEILNLLETHVVRND